MKILVQSDDYGITKAAADGMIDGITNGIITCTGLFSNMPWAEYAADRIRNINNICLGIDINVVCGPCVSDSGELPVLVNQETGWFYTTKDRMKDPRYGQDVFKPYEEVYKEACAQIEKFIELIGKLPEYLTSHSTNGSKTYLKAIHDAADSYHIPFSYDVYKKYNIVTMFRHMDKDPYSFENQIRDEIKPTLQMLEENKNKEYVLLPSHCGYVDSDLMRFSRCNIDRAYDHEMLVSPQIKSWIRENHAELISYRDLPMD